MIGALRKGCLLALCGWLILSAHGGAPHALAHAFPDHAEPRVGARLTTSPARVRIWFDHDLTSAGCTITVQDARGRTVDRRDGRVNSADTTLLEVSLPPLEPGSYRVLWSVEGRDGHASDGEYRFEIRQP